MSKEAKLRYKEELKAQISLNDESRKQSKEERDEESQKLKLKLQSEKDKISTIKESKINGLREGGIPEKYIAELLRTKIEV